MLHLIFCSLFRVANIFIKASVVWFALSRYQFCPILYISAERGVSAATRVCRRAKRAVKCAVQPPFSRRVKSISILNLNSHSKKTLKRKNLCGCQPWALTVLITTGEIPEQLSFLDTKVHFRSEFCADLQSGCVVKWLFFCLCRRPVNLAR